MNRYLVVYSARLAGAIGAYYPVSRFVRADNHKKAQTRAFELLHAEGYETAHVISVNESPDKESK